MFLSGQSETMGAIFSFITFGVAVPTAIKVCSWIATLYKGNIRWNTVMMYTLGFLWIFTIGGLTGLPLATLSTDVHLHDTYFVVAHFHYTMMGGVLFRIDHWYLPLVTKDDWSHVQRKGWRAHLNLCICSVQLDFHSSVHCRASWYASSLPRVFATV